MKQGVVAAHLKLNLCLSQAVHCLLHLTIYLALNAVQHLLCLR